MIISSMNTLAVKKLLKKGCDEKEKKGGQGLCKNADHIKKF